MTIPQTENRSSPHIAGTIPPILDPKRNPIQMNFLFIFLRQPGLQQHTGKAGFSAMDEYVIGRQIEWRCRTQCRRVYKLVSASRNATLLKVLLTTSLKFRLPSWNRRGGAKRRGGSQVEISPDYSYHPPSLDVGSASRSRCPPMLGGQFVYPHFQLDHYHFLNSVSTLPGVRYRFRP